MTRLWIIPALLLLSAPALAQKPGDPVPAEGGLTVFSEEDAAIAAAIAEAQRTLPLFLERVLDAEGYARTGTVKVSFQTFPENVGDEVIWVERFRRLPDGSYLGYLDNDPVNLGDWQVGTEVQFAVTAIEDWSLLAADGLLGNYTTRVVAGLPENAYLWDYLAPEPIPETWR